MQRLCDACRKPYDAKRASSRFCSTNCRVKAHKSGVGPVPVADVPVSAPSSLLAVTERELRAIGRLDTVVGQQAMLLARRADSAMDSAVPAISRELREVMAKALEGVQVAADPLDELRARRAAKSAG